jgi:dipeptidyl-peptidase-4
MPSDFPRTYAATDRFRFGTPQHVRVAPDGKAVLFLRSTARDARQSLYEMDVATGETRLLLDAARLLGQEEQLSPQERARRERQRSMARGFSTFELSRDGTVVLLPLSGRLYAFGRRSGQTRELPTGEGAAIDPQLSDDGKWAFYVRKNDVYGIPVDGGPEVAATRGGTDTVTHGLPEFIAQEELDRFHGFWVAPDASRVLFEEADTSKVDLFTIADPAHPERPADRIPYPRPGQRNADVRLGIAPARGGATTWVDWDHARFPYVAAARWAKSAPPTVYVLDRLQKNGLLLAVDPETGKTRTLLEAHDDAWLNIDPQMPRWLPDGHAFLWSSEASGAWQLEVHDATGKLVRAVTTPDVGYVGLVDVDDGGRYAIVNGAGEPTEMAAWAVPFDGTPPRRLLGGDGQSDHALSLGGGAFAALETSSTLLQRFSVRPVTADGDSGAPREIPSVAEAPPSMPNVQIARVGAEQYRVAILRPSGFVPGRKYPVIDAAYGGPHVNTVSFGDRGYLFEQWLADATSAIVVLIDAKGTPRRGRAWERAIAGKLAEVPLEGHVAALAALGAAYPEIDSSHVGVLGWSYGGFFAALAVLARPDVYDVAFAAAPPADWRDYDTAYTERYLGLPEENAAAYDASSLLVWAKKNVQPVRPLLLLHGTADDNVYFFHTLKLADALERAGRPFELVPIVGATHRVKDPDMQEDLWLRAADFLRRGLAK